MAGIGTGVELERLVELSDDLCCVLTHPGVFKWVSPAWERVLGWRPDELIGRHAFELIHPDDTASSRELGRREVSHFQNRYQHKDGSWHTLLWKATPANGCWYAVARHVGGASEHTERRLREDRLYRAIIEQTTQGIWALDADDRTVFVNRQMAVMLDYEPQAMVGRRVYDFLDPEAAEATRAGLRRRRDGISELREIRLLRHDRVPITVLIESSPLVDEHGDYTGSVAMVSDISGRKRAEEQLALLAAVVESSNDAVIACSLDGAVQSWNPAAERLFGHAASAMSGRTLSMILPTDDESLLELIDTAASGQLVGPVEIDAIAHDGERVPVELTAFPVEAGDGGRVTGIAVTMRDVHERREVEQRLREHELLVGNIERAGRVGTWEWYVDDRDAVLSDEVYRILGVERGDHAPGAEALRSAIHPDDRARVYEAAERSERELAPLAVRFRIIRPNGEVRHVDVSAYPATAPGRRGRRMTGTIQDVTPLVVAEESARAARAELRRQALRDPLTGLPNRTLFLDRLGRALAQAERSGSTVAVIMVGVDRFALVNEELGHAAGDSVLRAVAQRLVGVMRAGDTVGRLSGDEFAIVCEDVQPSQPSVDALAARVVDAFGEPYEIEGREIYLSASAGVAWTEDDERADALVRRASAALSSAKDRERGSFVVASRAGKPYAGYGRLALRNALRDALEDGQLRLVFQPIVDLASRRPRALEALLRWDHPGLGPVSPLEFVPVAEDTGLINPIGEWVMREACRIVAARDDDIAVSVNLSARQLLQQDLVHVVRSALRESGLEPGRLILELTESILVEETEAVGRTLSELKHLGVRLALDDFGTGYSALGYLKRFPLDIVKVDRSFVHGLGRDAGDSAIVGAVLGMATALGLEVVAEGVETEQQLACLVDLGAHYAQGFYFARPCAYDEVDAEIGGRRQPA